jgi:hypothetical protein
MTGIFHGMPAHELPPEAWSAGGNVQMIDGSVHKAYGHSAVLGTPGVAPHWLLPFNDQVNYYWIYPGLAKVYVVTGVTHTNITRQTASVDVDYNATAAKGWTGGVLNGIPILNNGVDAPQMWSPPNVSTRLQALANWPANTTAGVLRPYKNYLVALDITVSGTRNPRAVRWSHPADPGTVPTSWDYANPAVDAGLVELAETVDALVDCKPLGDVNILYKEETTWGMQYTGGAYVFRFYKMFGDVGAINKRCAQEFYRKHLVASRGDLVLHDGQQAQSILRKKQATALFNSIDATHYTKAFLALDPQNFRAWFCYPENGMTYCNKALLWHWKDNTFSVRDLPQVAFMEWGIVDPNADNSFDSDSGTMDSDPGTFDDTTGFNPTTRSLLIAGTSTTQLYRVDSSYQFAGVNFTSYIERTGLSITGRDRQGNPRESLTSRKLVRRVWPKMRATGPVNVYVGGQESPGGAVTYTGPYSFDPAAQKYVNCLVNTPLIAVRFESTGNVDWALDGYALDMQEVSRY